MKFFMPTFLSIYLQIKYKKKNIFRSPPLSAPEIVKPPKSDPPWRPISPNRICRIPFYNKNGGVCKKLDINILRIDWAIAISSLNFFLNFEKFFLMWKIDITRAIFRVLKIFFLYDHRWTPLTIDSSKIVSWVQKLVQISWE